MAMITVEQRRVAVLALAKTLEGVAQDLEKAADKAERQAYETTQLEGMLGDLAVALIDLVVLTAVATNCTPRGVGNAAIRALDKEVH